MTEGASARHGGRGWKESTESGKWSYCQKGRSQNIKARRWDCCGQLEDAESRGYGGWAGGVSTQSWPRCGADRDCARGVGAHLRARSYSALFVDGAHCTCLPRAVGIHNEISPMCSSGSPFALSVGVQRGEAEAGAGGVGFLPWRDPSRCGKQTKSRMWTSAGGRSWFVQSGKGKEEATGYLKDDAFQFRPPFWWADR